MINSIITKKNDKPTRTDIRKQPCTQLQKLGYKNVVINDETDLLANLKSQLEVHNSTNAIPCVLSENAFSKGSIDGTNNTNTLVKQMTGENKLIVTTIQKLNTAISKKRYLNQMETPQDKRIVFIFDECHRSQFEKTHDDIKNFFTNCQMFGFTGTPIFEKNAGTNEFGKRTTKMLFDKKLHQYVITDAIRNENVLKFSLEYISTFKKKDHILDIDVEAIDEAEVMNAPERLNNITDYIVTNHSRKTHNNQFTSIFAVSSVDTLIEYYKLFLQKKEGVISERQSCGILQ